MNDTVRPGSGVAPPDTPTSASINRVRIIDLADIALDEAVRGEQAYHLLSVPALIDYAQQAADELRLPHRYRHADPALPRIRQELPRYINDCLNSTYPQVQSAAHALAQRMGRNLGYILIALQRGDPLNRAARPDWPTEAWEDWADVRKAWLGGGLLSGTLGDEIVTHAWALLMQTGYADTLTVAKTPRPHHMALLGASRYLPIEDGNGLCLDLGQTSVKRAVMTFDQGTLTRMRWLPSMPVAWRWQNTLQAQRAIDGHEVLAFVVEAIADAQTSVENQDLALAPEAMLSVAAYVSDGHLLGNGLYAQMDGLAADVQSLISARVRQLCGVDLSLSFIHDGTAAAALHAGEPSSAVIVVGTALGVGFPPPTSDGLRSLSQHLVIEEI